MKRPVLNRQLLLETAVRTADGSGGSATTWQSVGALWADVTARTGGDVGRVGLTVSRANYRIVVRGAPDGAPSRPRPGQRFTEGGRIFEILAVTEADAAARFLTCFAREEGVKT